MLQKKNQASALLTLPAVGLDLRVTQYRVQESLSVPFRSTVHFSCCLPAIDFEAVIGMPASLALDDGQGGVPRYVAGIVESFQQIGGGLALQSYVVSIVPPLAFLDHRSDNRIFQYKTVIDIITDVFKAAALPAESYTFRTTSTYVEREYCLQYRETDLAFVQRLLAEEGLWYFFEHQATGALMVIVDDNQTCTVLPGKDALHHTPDGGLSHQSFINTLHIQERIATGAFRQRDYTFRRPAYNLETQTLSDKHPDLLIYRYPGRYKTDDVGTPFSRMLLEAQQCQTSRVNAQSNHMPCCPGHSLVITSDVMPELTGTYLIISASHMGSQPQATEQYGGEGTSTYSNHLTLIPLAVPFRDNIPVKPTVAGPQTAVVVGPSGEEIYVDEYARVKVQFHWDRYGVKNEHSSAWIRVSQPWAGGGWGGMFIPRIGHEVVVDFLEGDPDQPLITGRVYNAANMPPYKLPQHKTRSTIKSDSHKKSGSNELRFEDEAHQEQIYLHGEKDLDIIIENDRREWIRNTRHLRVDDNKFEEVYGSSHLTVRKEKRERIVGNHHRTVDGNVIKRFLGSVGRFIGKGLIERIDGSRSLDIGASEGKTIAIDQSCVVGGDTYTKANNVVIEATAALTIKGPGGFVKIDGSGVTIVGTVVKINQGGSAGVGSKIDAPSPNDPTAPLQPADADKR
jgi:type VI secretion system secreted protein VgrG